MHVNLNCFDYPNLLTGIIEHYNLQDDLTDESVARVFSNFAKMYRNQEDHRLSDDHIKMVESFLGSTISYINYDDEDFVTIQEQIDNGLEMLQSCLIEKIDEVPYGSFSEKYVYGKYVTLPESDDEPMIDHVEQIVQFIDFFDNLIHRYCDMKSIKQFGPGEIFILGEIEKHTHPCEVVTNLDILDRPGAKVKYGDSLITFPIILLEVTGE